MIVAAITLSDLLWVLVILAILALILFIVGRR